MRYNVKGHQFNMSYWLLTLNQCFKMRQIIGSILLTLMFLVNIAVLDLHANERSSALRTLSECIVEYTYKGVVLYLTLCGHVCS
jgi:hypothetical protein